MTYALTQAGLADTILVSGTIDDNVVVNNQSVTIAQDPAGSPAELNGTGKGPVITTEGSALLTVNQLTITGGSAPFGGGIFMHGGDATITDSTISGNTATNSGGGIGNDSYFNLIDSTVSGNSAPGSGFIGGSGAGIATDASGSDTIVRSTISGNTAGGVGSGAEGGGIVNVGGSQIISNSTISGNTATGTNGGGGGVSNEAGSVAITDSTISGNSATSYGAAIESVSGFNLAADILADAGGPPAVSECHGRTPSTWITTWTMTAPAGCRPRTTASATPATIGSFLGPLQNNGGPTETIALSSGAHNPAQAVIPLAFTAFGEPVASCRQPDRAVSPGVLRATWEPTH